VAFIYFHFFEEYNDRINLGFDDFELEPYNQNMSLKHVRFFSLKPWILKGWLWRIRQVKERSI
jgi:hypothetical protein